MKRIGIFLGSFNPPHIGHISMVATCVNEYIKKRNLLDNIWVIPAYQNPNKTNTNNYEERLYWCDSSQGGFGYIPDVFVKDIEYDLKPKYTIELIEYLKSHYTDTEFVWLITWDTINEIIDNKWYASSRLLDENKFIIINEGLKRIDDFDIEYVKYRMMHSNTTRCNNIIDVLTLPNPIKISSTVIRNMVRDELCPIPYITPDIWESMILDYK
jgi:nicotinate-nucleotide adenylyltransferase